MQSASTDIYANSSGSPLSIEWPTFTAWGGFGTTYYVPDKGFAKSMSELPWVITSFTLNFNIFNTFYGFGWIYGFGIFGFLACYALYLHRKSVQWKVARARQPIFRSFHTTAQSSTNYALWFYLSAFILMSLTSLLKFRHIFYASPWNLVGNVLFILYTLVGLTITIGLIIARSVEDGRARVI